MRYRDRFLTCPDCTRLFRFTRGDQRLSYELGYETPTLCLACRRSLEAARQ